LREFTQNAFAAAQHQGKPIIVHITASWCPTCAAQRPVIAHLESEPEFADLLVFNVDFDTRKDVVRQMRARMQSTIVAFRGDKEVGRSVGDTKSDSIRALLDQAVR
jgi:thioredoxin 1